MKIVLGWECLVLFDVFGERVVVVPDAGAVAKPYAFQVGLSGDLPDVIFELASVGRSAQVKVEDLGVVWVVLLKERNPVFVLAQGESGDEDAVAAFGIDGFVSDGSHGFLSFGYWATAKPPLAEKYLALG